MRVHIIGLPSAGKSSLAESLTGCMGCVHHDLDAVAFVDDRWTPRPVEEREATVARILEESSFVTEGGFLGWTAPLFAAGDLIIWLDPPLRVLVRRHLQRFGVTRPRWLVARIRFQVLSYLRPPGFGPARDDPNQTRSGIGDELRPSAHKVLRIRREASAEEVIAAVNAWNA